MNRTEFSQLVEMDTLLSPLSSERANIEFTKTNVTLLTTVSLCALQIIWMSQIT